MIGGRIHQQYLHGELTPSNYVERTEEGCGVRRYQVGHGHVHVVLDQPSRSMEGLPLTRKRDVVPHRQRVHDSRGETLMIWTLYAYDRRRACEAIEKREAHNG